MAESIDMDELLHNEEELRKLRGDFLDEDDEDLEEDDDEDEDDDDELEDDDDEDLPEDEDSDDEDEDLESDEEDEDLESDEEDEDLEISGKDNRIPRSRFNQVISQRDAERKRTEWLEKQLEKLISGKDLSETSEIESKPPEYDFDTKEKQYLELVIEGEIDKAISLRKEIDKAKEDQFNWKLDRIKKEAESNISNSTKASREEAKFDTVVRNLENKYPFLDSEKSEYNEDAVDTVNTLLAGYASNGMDKTEALQKAVSKVVPMFTKSTTAKKVDDRKKRAMKKNVRAAKKQPPVSKGKSNRERSLDDLDPLAMSEKEWKKLSLREKKELRGDF